jgi:hypothetical protein
MALKDTDNLGPGSTGQTSEGVWPYLGVGCLSAVVGLAGGGMIAVLIAKIVGGISGCHGDAETGAPCNWSIYWTWGARIGLILVPTIVIWRMRRARSARKNSE